MSLVQALLGAESGKNKPAPQKKSDETNMWLKQHAVCRTHFNPQGVKHCKGGRLL